MIYKIRVILDTKDDVFRDIEIRDKQTLFTLYKGIMSAFSLQGEELASFYESDEQWNQGREIPLESMDEDSDETMADFYIHEAFPQVGSRMIFVYDYMEMWTFFVEVMAIEEKKAVLNYPLTVYRYGIVPLKAPKKSLDVISLEDDEEILSADTDDESAFDELDIDSDLDIDDM